MFDIIRLSLPADSARARVSNMISRPSLQNGIISVFAAAQRGHQAGGQGTVCHTWRTYLRPHAILDANMHTIPVAPECPPPPAMSQMILPLISR